MIEKDAGLNRKTAKTQRRWRVRSLAAAVVLLGVLAAFVGGMYAGRWAVRNQGVERVKAELSSLFATKPPDNADVSADWQPKNTALVRLETSLIHLPDSDGGFGGGLQSIDDGRILYSTRTGDFGVIGSDGLTKLLPFKIEMNLEALKHHPIFHEKKFDQYWFRVTGMNLSRIAPDRYELLVSHHYFEPHEPCVETRLSRAVLTVTSADISMVEPFRTIMTTKPCITFNFPDYEFAFEGHFSGGRIVKIGADKVLFSTGDHGWVGLRGYPAVSQDDNATLGKILLVNLVTHDVSIFAKGVRNPQGLIIDSKGLIWETEQGPRGGDELNLISKGGNYGWPSSTYGTDYGPLPWPLNNVQGQHSTGITPQFAWNPSIGVSNLIEVTGSEFPLWKGDLLAISLNGQSMHRLRLDGTRVVYDEPIRFEGDRLRDIIELPTGRIALLTDHAKVIILRNSDGYKFPFLDVRREQPRTVDMSDQQRASAIAGRYAKPENAVAVTSKHLSPDAARGELVFKANCASCHSLDSSVSGVGPSLKGVIGRRVGSGDYAYSGALIGKSEAWTSRRILDFATNPSSFYSGTAMEPVILTADLRKDLETYLNASGH